MSIIRALLAPRASFGDVTNPGAFLQRGGYGSKTTAGENVSPATALTLSTWFACIRNIAEDIAKLPLELYELQAKGGKKLAIGHPVRRLLSTAPNPEMTPATFRETITGWALGWGNGYAEIERDGAGTPVALWPIHPWRMRVHRVSGSIVYDVWCGEDASVRAVSLPAKDVLHIRGFGDDPLCGLSVARLAAESIGASLGVRTFGAAFFGNGATLGLTLEHPGKLKEDAAKRLRESWAAAHAGPENAHKVAVLEEGMKANRISVPPDEAQFIETMVNGDTEIAKFFRMPLHKIQRLERATFGNIEHQSIEYVVDCLMPWFGRWEGEGKRKLLDARDAERFAFRHLVNALMRGDAASRSNYARTMISTGVMTINEAREIEDLNPVDGEIGDKLFLQGAMSTVDRIVDPPAPPPVAAAGAPAKPDDQVDEENDAAAAAQQAVQMRPVFADAAARCHRKEEMAIASAMRKHATQATFAPWAADFYASHLAYLVDAFAPCVASLGNAIVAERTGYRVDDAAVLGALRDYCANAQRHVAATGAPFKPDQPLADTILAIMTLEISHA